MTREQYFMIGVSIIKKTFKNLFKCKRMKRNEYR